LGDGEWPQEEGGRGKAIAKHAKTGLSIQGKKRYALFVAACRDKKRGEGDSEISAPGRERSPDVSAGNFKRTRAQIAEEKF